MGKTVDGTGAQWCYVDSSSSSCQDLVPSERFPHNPWSYQACATPEIGSIFCPVVADYVHVPVVVPAAQHVHVPVVVPLLSMSMFLWLFLLPSMSMFLLLYL